MFYVDYINKTKGHNGISGNFDKQMKKYLKCCETLSNSLKKFSNQELIIITNDKKYINKICPNLNCIEINFSFETPSDIKFYSAHKKIDVFKYFSEIKSDNYLILLDSDVVCINYLPQSLDYISKNKIPIYYDLTKQVLPAYGIQKIIKDKEKIMNNNSAGVWCGGELIGGDSVFYNKLSKKINLLKDNYLNNYKNLHHQGDEMIVSSAIELLMQENQVIYDAGNLKLISRYWSTNTKHIQEKIESLKDNFLLHLPNDKEYLAKSKDIDKEKILREVKRKILLAKFKYILNKIICRG